MPRISYRRSLALMSLWGLVFVVVLTMISGARELMTPQAWEYKENGWTQQLVQQDSSTNERSVPDDRTPRIVALVRLHLELVALARQNDGLFPPLDAGKGVSPELWTIPGRHGLRFSVVPNLSLADVTSFLLHEPLGEGNSVLAIRVNGEIIEQPEDVIRTATERPVSALTVSSGVE